MGYFPKLSVGKFAFLFVLSFVLGALFAFSYTSWIEVNGASIHSNESSSYLGLICSYLGLLLFIWWLSLTKIDRERIWEPSPARSPRHMGFILAPTLSVMPIFAIYGFFIEYFMPEFSENMGESSFLQEGNLVSQNPLSIFLLFLIIVVIGPLVEEIIFRGVLYNLLSDRMSLVAAAIASSIIFGLLHGENFFQVTVSGFVYAFIYQVTGDIKMAVSAHAFHNGVVFAQGVLYSIGTGEGAFSEGIMLLLLLFWILLSFISLVMVVVAVKYLRKNSLRSVFNDSAPMFKHEIFARHQLEQVKSGEARQAGKEHQMVEDEAVNFRFNV